MKCIEHRSIDAMSEQCLALLRTASTENLYTSETWMCNMVNHGLDEGHDPRIFSVLREDDSSCCALAFLQSPAGQNGSAFKSWKPGKSSLASLVNFQSSFFSIITDRCAEDLPQIFDCLAQGMSSATNTCPMVDFNLMDAESPEFKLLQASMKKAHYWCRPYTYKGNWYELIQQDNFSDYLQARPKSAKKAIQNYMRKYRRLERDGRIRVEIFDDDTHLDYLLQTYHRIYSDSWKEEDHFPDFYSGLIRATARDGSLRMLFVYLDEMPVAFEYAILIGGNCTMMRTAYLAEHQRESVGSIAILYMIERAISEGVKEIDFGTDDDPYKSTWVSGRRIRSGLICLHTRSARGLFYRGRHTAKSLAESALGHARRVRQQYPQIHRLAISSVNLRQIATAGIARTKPTVLKTAPHDPAAFTQGLAWSGGCLYESTGLEDASSIRRLSMTSTVPEIQLPLKNHWGEGIAVRDDELVQLTWRSELAMVYSLPELKPTRSLQYRGEGWGLSACGDGFVMTNGSNQLVFRDQYFEVVRTLSVSTRGLPLRWLNDLTCANDRLYINRLGDSCIYEVDPKDGRVTRILDCSEIVSAESPAGAEDQLNGIAYLEDENVFVLTGKRWSKLYFVSFPE